MSRLERSQRKKETSRAPEQKDAIDLEEYLHEDEGNYTFRGLEQSAINLKKAPIRKVHSAFKYVNSIKNLAQMKCDSEKSQTLLAKTCHSGFKASMVDLKSQRDELKENTMKMIDMMGIKPPNRWRDELYKNELMKLDAKRQLRKIGHNANSRCASVMTSNGSAINIDFGRYFDTNLQTNLVKLQSAAKTNSKVIPRKPELNCSAGKNIKQTFKELSKNQVSLCQTSQSELQEISREMNHVENIILKKEDQIYLDHLKNKNIINARMCDRHL